MDQQKRLIVDPVETFNAVVYALLSIACFGAVLHERVKDGLVMRVGLSFMALGFAGMAGRLYGGMHAGELRSLQNLMMCVNIGVCVTAVGFVYRFKTCQVTRERASDFVKLDEAQHVGGNL